MGMSAVRNHGIFWARRNLVAAVVAAIFVCIAAMLAMPSPARAANLVVTSNADSGAGTLREAVATANGNTVADTITFDLPADSRTITLASEIIFGATQNTTIDGGAAGVTVSGGNASRVFQVRFQGNLTVKRLTVSDGNVTSGCCDTDGGGIEVISSGTTTSSLTVIDSTVSGNRAVNGGGIYSDGTTTIENSTISGNTATFRGGGISNADGRTNITSSTITKNSAPSLISSHGGGAGVASYGDTSTHTMVANSIISANSAQDVDCVAGTTNSFTSQGYNIIGTSGQQFDSSLSCPRAIDGVRVPAIDAFNNTGDQKGVTDPKLGSLQDNNGPTQTHALLTGSKAIDKGSTTLATDQRGVSRPQGVGVAPVDDVGAFELEVVNTAPVASGQDVTTSEDVAKKITLTATDADNNPLTYKVSTLPTDGTLYKGDATNPANQTNANEVVVDTALPGAEVTYVPNANYNNDTTTPAPFSFVANDGTTDSAAATVTVTVTAVNDAPSFTKGANQTVAEDASAQTVTGWATAISSGPSNESTQTVSFTATTNNNALFSAQPQVSSGGTLTYTPAANANGTATVTVTAKDSGGTADGGVDTSVTQTFTITVTAVDDNPVAGNDTKTVAEDDAATAINVLSNDTDIDGGPKSVQSVTQPTNGTVEITGSATGLTYKPNANYCNGGGSTTDNFTYTLNGNSTATVNMTVTCVNDKPSFTSQGNQTVNEDSRAQPVTGWVTNFNPGPANESGQQVADYIVTDTSGNAVNSNLFTNTGQPDVSNNGTLTYTLTSDANGSITIKVKVQDNGGTANGGVDTSDAQDLTITVSSVNDAPVATDGTASMDEDAAPISIDFGALVSDVETSDAQDLTYNITAPPAAKGTLSGSGSTRTFDSADDFNGTVEIPYTVTDRGDPDNCGQPSTSCDAPETSATGTLTITVNAVDDAPTVTLTSGGSCSTSTTSVSGTMNLSLADVDSPGVPTLSATSSKPALVPVANIKLGGSGANRTVSIAPAAKKSGSATITFTATASDGTPKSSTTTIQVIVGTDRKETINGIGADMIFGQNGDDTINAGDGNDLVCGGNAGGVISGGAGDDTMDGGNGNDVLRGDAGKDIVRGSAGNDTLTGDTLTGGSEADSFDGGSGTDVATDYNAAEGDMTTNIP
jgi:predicted outer membrane repeat protein